MQCLGLSGAGACACAACSHCTATAWELSDLDHSHAATPQRVTRASCVLSSCVLTSVRLAPPAVDLLEALDRCVCTRRACCFCLLYRTSAASVELRPRGRRAVAFPRWLHLRDRSGSTWHIVILMVRCCFGGLCVRDRLAACLRLSHFCCFR